MIRSLKISIIFIFSFLICLWTKESLINSLLDKVFFNTLSILAGLSIAIVGIFLGSINSLYLSIYKMIKSDGSVFSDSDLDLIKNGISGLVFELKENTFLTIYGLIIILLSLVAKYIDIPFVQWFIVSDLIKKEFCINTLIIFISSLMIWSIVDSIKVIFSMTKAFAYIKN
jgi:hypothetical protein